MLLLIDSPAKVAVRHGEVDADDCSSASLRAWRNELIVSGAAGGPGTGLDASAFIIVWRGMSVDLAFFRWARNAPGSLNEVAPLDKVLFLLAGFLLVDSTGLVTSAAGCRRGGSSIA